MEQDYSLRQTHAVVFHEVGDNILRYPGFVVRIPKSGHLLLQVLANFPVGHTACHRLY